jgi:nitrite reductase/ring-hydroxylating ferredoxin subunit/alkylhydroperoxidase/carboxymuconolactone decarboxylase family protein YurZ
MSDALKYLMQVRPDAMTSYFDFVKKSGTHLDKKTRALISVITKVENQTETGFKQYLVRALQAGATANEIIDALLTAFPTLGLSKIIWAMEIILELDIPEFQPDALVDKSDWHSLIVIEKIINAVTNITCDDRDLFIYHKNRVTRVYDSHCPHQATNIPQLALCENILTCPKHQWKFDITTGECIENGNRPLKQYQTMIKDGTLFALW